MSVWKTVSAASARVSAPSSTARAPAMTVAPNMRVAHSGVTAVENSPAAWPRVKSATSGSPKARAPVRAILLAEPAAGVADELREAVALRDLEPRVDETAQRLGGAALVEPAVDDRLLAGGQRLRADGVDQRLAGREVAVDRGPADIRGFRDGGHADVRVVADHPRGDLHDAVEVARGVGAEVLGRALVGGHLRHHCST